MSTIIDVSSDSDDDLLDYNPFHRKPKRRKSNNAYASNKNTGESSSGITMSTRSSSRLTTSSKPPLIRKRTPPPSDPQAEPQPPTDEQKQQAIETAAKRDVKRAFVPNDINSPDELFWHKKTKRGGYKRKATVVYFPCRTCHPDYAKGLDLPQQWDDNEKVLVQFIDGTTFGQYDVVTRKSLLPYYDGGLRKKSCSTSMKKEKDGGEGDQYIDNDVRGVYLQTVGTWCPDTMSKMLKDRRVKSKKRRSNSKRRSIQPDSPSSSASESMHMNIDEMEVDCRSMELYMNQVLETACKRGKKDANELIVLEDGQLLRAGCSDTTTIDLLSPSSQGNEPATMTHKSQSEEVIDIDDRLPASVPATASSDNDSDDDFSSSIRQVKRKTERIRPGDVIEYYQLSGTFGDERFHRRTRVLEVHPRKKDFPLVVANGEYIPRECQIRRVEIIMRGKMKDNSKHANWSMIDDYILQAAKIATGDSNGTSSTGTNAGGIMTDVKRINSILEKNQSRFLEKSKSIVGDASDILNFQHHACGVDYKK